jgi:hypothetical protein
MGKYVKAIFAFFIAGLGVMSTGLDGGLTGNEIITAIVSALLAGGTTYGVPNAGFLDLSKLTADQRAQINSFLNLK